MGEVSFCPFGREFTFADTREKILLSVRSNRSNLEQQQTYIKGPSLDESCVLVNGLRESERRALGGSSSVGGAEAAMSPRG